MAQGKKIFLKRVNTRSPYLTYAAFCVAVGDIVDRAAVAAETLGFTPPVTPATNPPQTRVHVSALCSALVLMW